MRDPEAKIMDAAALAAWRAELRRQGCRLVMTNGCFDILHRGHASYLHRARLLGDALLVAVNSDATVRQLKGPTRPVNHEADRSWLLAALEAVDAVVVFDTLRVTPLLEQVQPDIYVKGGDYTVESIPQDERRAAEAGGARIVFLPFVEGHSTTRVIRRIHGGGGGAGGGDAVMQ
ncbi:MAG: adenylyltransferase/cytidyltransferase family protein [Lentisphaeria bacterium]|jgi:rfaE bifunctional protein nucleotidyltransferase chain/domain